MTDPVLVGLLDSGVAEDLAAHVTAGCAFRPTSDSAVGHGDPELDTVGHGSSLARVILSHAPGARLLNAQVLGPRGTTSAAAVAAGLDWLTAQGAALINMSLGLHADRDELRAACDAALAEGCVLLGASPARGAPVYPSAYPGVVRITGDARCAPGEISHLATAQADFGACVRADGESPSPVAGASAAVGHASGLLAAHFSDSDARGGEAARRFFEQAAAYRGPERKTAADVGKR